MAGLLPVICIVRCFLYSPKGLCYNEHMSTKDTFSPLHQLEELTDMPESGVIDRIADHQRITVPHWVENREDCLVGRYASFMPVADAVAEIRRAEAAAELSPAHAAKLATFRQMAIEQPHFWPEYESVDEKVAAQLVETDRDDVLSLPVARTVLTDFLGLHVRKATAIEAFARRFGMLHTYTEGFVSPNRLTRTTVWSNHYKALPEHVREEDRENGIDVFEPIAYWQAFSRFAFLTLKIATQLDEVPLADVTISSEEWQFFEDFLRVQPRRQTSSERSKKRQPDAPPSPPDSPFSLTSNRDKFRVTFCGVLNELQDIGDVKLELRWEKSPPTLEFRVTGLASVIASQLLMAASQRENFVLCKECLKAFRPWQQPLTGKVDLYCTECREAQAPQRNATKRYRTTDKYQAYLHKRRLRNEAAGKRADDFGR